MNTTEIFFRSTIFQKIVNLLICLYLKLQCQTYYQARTEFRSPDLELPDNREHVHLVVHGQLLDGVVYSAEHSTQDRTISTEIEYNFKCCVADAWSVHFLDKQRCVCKVIYLQMTVISATDLMFFANKDAPSLQNVWESLFVWFVFVISLNSLKILFLDTNLKYMVTVFNPHTIEITNDALLSWNVYLLYWYVEI